MKEFKQIIRFGVNQGQQRSRVINHVMEIVVDEKHEWEVTVKPYKESKTTLQRAYYWGVVVKEFMHHTGHTKDEADTFLKEKLTIPIVKSILGVVIEIRVSIAKMKIDEMARYIDQCIIFMALNDMAVPPPTYKGAEDVEGQKVQE